MKLREGEVVLHDLRPAKNAPMVWLLTRMLGDGALLALVGIGARALAAPFVIAMVYYRSYRAF